MSSRRRPGSKALARLRLVKSKARARCPILPRLALRTKGSTAVAYASAYFRAKIKAPFFSPLARDFDFVIESPTRVRVPSRSRYDLVATIENELIDIALYLSNFLTHPRYAGEKQVGFVRGDTLRPVALREVERGTYQFRVRGVAVGRRDLLQALRGPNKDGPPAPTMHPAPPGSLRAFFTMPTRPDAGEVGETEWYDFRPSTWRRKHPTIPLRPPLAVLFTPRPPGPAPSPQYDRLYRDGVVRIALVFGYDEKTHLTTEDARDVWEILTSAPGVRFTGRRTGKYGYHGPGLGFSDPTSADFRKLNFDGTSVFRRDSVSGAGPLAVRYQLVSGPLRVGGRKAPEGTIFVAGRPVRAGVSLPSGTLVDRAVSAEIRLYNFDKSAPRVSSEELISQFVSVFQDNDVIHYDGHANYGGGFFLGDQPNDLFWADDIGSYAESFSRNYQVLSLGACHAAGYFADLFYNELRPRKSPRNLDVMAAVNETEFSDAVHSSMDLIRAVLQGTRPRGSVPPDYQRIILQMSRPAAFQAFLGVFAKSPQKPVTKRRR